MSVGLHRSAHVGQVLQNKQRVWGKHVDVNIAHFLATDGRGLDWEYLKSKLNKHFDWNAAVNGILGTKDERAVDVVSEIS